MEEVTAATAPSSKTKQLQTKSQEPSDISQLPLSISLKTELALVDLQHSNFCDPSGQGLAVNVIPRSVREDYLQMLVDPDMEANRFADDRTEYVSDEQEDREREEFDELMYMDQNITSGIRLPNEYVPDGNRTVSDAEEAELEAFIVRSSEDGLKNPMYISEAGTEVFQSRDSTASLPDTQPLVAIDECMPRKPQAREQGDEPLENKKILILKKTNTIRVTEEDINEALTSAHFPKPGNSIETPSTHSDSFFDEKSHSPTQEFEESFADTDEIDDLNAV